MEGIDLERLEIYRMGRDLSRVAWKIYQPLNWQLKKIIGDQFITAADSYGANVAEAHGRFHYLDRAKFLFYARGSLFESLHWLDVMVERQIVKEELEQECRVLIQQIAPKLNKFITSHFDRNRARRSSTSNSQ